MIIKMLTTSWRWSLAVVQNTTSYSKWRRPGLASTKFLSLDTRLYTTAGSYLRRERTLYQRCSFLNQRRKCNRSWEPLKLRRAESVVRSVRTCEASVLLVFYLRLFPFLPYTDPASVAPSDLRHTRVRISGCSRRSAWVFWLLVYCEPDKASCTPQNNQIPATVEATPRCFLMR